MIEKIFESLLWRSRFISITAVIASLLVAILLFCMGSYDVYYTIAKSFDYFGSSGTEHSELHNILIVKVVKIVDTFLLAIFMLMFSFGIYEIFVSEIDEAQETKNASNILDIRTLDDLKSKLAKVIVMIFIVTILKHGLQLKINTTMELLQLGGTLALIGLALFLASLSDKKKSKTEKND